MKKIALSQGRVALIDEEDFEMISQWKWHYQHPGYAVRTEYNGKKMKTIGMHRTIMNTPSGMQVDHRNHDRLDNRKKNLRNVTRSQNSFNSRPHRDAVSKYKGVHWNGKERKWIVQIRKNKQRFYKSFKSEKDAALYYNEKAREIFGEFAFLNKITID